MKPLHAFLIVLASVTFTACTKDTSTTLSPPTAPPPDRGPIPIATGIQTMSATYVTTPVATPPDSTAVKVQKIKKTMFK